MCPSWGHSPLPSANSDGSSAYHDLAGAFPPRRSPTPPPPRRTEPTTEYHETSSQMPSSITNPTSVPKLLVLDLNGTFVLRGDRRRVQNQQFSHPKAYENSGPPPRALRTVYPRPYLGTFREFIFHAETKKWLDTMVWSSAQPHSVADMVDKSFEEQKGELKDVWARDTLGLTRAEYNQKTQTTKDLDRIWQEVVFTDTGTIQKPRARSPTPSSSRSRPGSPLLDLDPTVGRRHSAKSTLLMDDSPLKAILQPWNHLCIPEYDAEMRRRDMAAKALVLERQQTDDAKLQDVQARLNAINETLKAGPTTTEDGTTDKAAKKKEVKKLKKELEKLKKEAQNLSNRPDARDEVDEPRFDETLLAVVGILDTIKSEGNVAAWMKRGGLVNIMSSSALDELSDALSQSGRDLSPSLLCDEERRTQESTGIPLVPPEVPATVPLVEGATGPLWFQDPRILASWAERGKKACEVLDIEVRTGFSSADS